MGTFSCKRILSKVGIRGALGSAAAAAIAFFREEKDYNPIIEDPDFLDFNENSSNEIVVSDLNSRHQGIEFDEQLANAQQQLKELKKQEEEIEKQKAELEYLRQMQSAFNRGKVEMLDNLQHAITLLERERLDAEQKILQYSRARYCFFYSKVYIQTNDRSQGDLLYCEEIKSKSASY